MLNVKTDFSDLEVIFNYIQLKIAQCINNILDLNLLVKTLCQSTCSSHAHMGGNSK